MRSRGAITAVCLLAAVWAATTAQVGGRQGAGRDAADGESKVVDLKADVVYPIEWRDTTVFCLVGNFAAQHNGAVITCDSAVRYSDKRIECFGNVLINKNTTYVYGDRAEYNGEINEARVYSDIVKVVDGDATLYTYDFSFNTLDNIGTFNDGGVVINRDNIMESERGYYYADLREMICVERVEMRNETYQMTGDSVVYNLATDYAQYFDHTNIWNDKDEYLYADRGTYEKPQERYTITRNGYILTEKQELWSDSLDYYRAEEHAVLHRNIQIDDTEHKMLSFGDYGEYWKEPGNALLTLEPALIGYDTEEQPDSLFLRADTIRLYTLYGALKPEGEAAADADVAPAAAAEEGPGEEISAPSPQDFGEVEAAPEEDQEDNGPLPVAGGDAGVGPAAPVPAAEADPDAAALQPEAPKEDAAVSETGEADSETGDAGETVVSGEEEADAPAAAEALTKEERRAKLRELAEQKRAEKRAQAAAKRKARDAEIIAKRRAKLLEQKERDEAMLARRRAKTEAKLQQRRERAERKGKTFVADSSELKRLDSLLAGTQQTQDSLRAEMADSLDGVRDSMAVDSLMQDTLAVDTLPPADSMWRLMKAYRNVRVYRSDFQSVCDSMVGISTDSTIHLYIDPVLWNETNQITSDVMDLFSSGGELVRGEFIGKPLMVSELDTLCYNQVTGKEMTAYFRKNQIYRNDVNGSAETLYYMQESGSPEVIGLMTITSGSITFYIDDQTIEQITYRSNPEYTIFPMDKIPESQARFLQNFKWEAERRPERAGIFDRTIRPTQRAEKEALPRPKFPIMEAMERRKRQLIERGVWLDRNDVLTPETVEWMHSLGY